MIDQLRINVDKELEMIHELAGFYEKLSMTNSTHERRLFLDAIGSIQKQMKILNNSIPELLRGISFGKPASQQTHEPVLNVVQMREHAQLPVTVKKEDRERFLNELNINTRLVKELRKRKTDLNSKQTIYFKPTWYGKISNKIFFKISEQWVRAGNFKSLSLDLRRSNLGILTTTYISMMILSTVLSIFVGIFLVIFLLFFKIGAVSPFISIYDGAILARLLKTSWLIIGVPLATAGLFYIYPGAERSSISKRIDSELPFMVIHMGSISGSGIDPVAIFKIIGKSNEYKFAGKEVRKILNETTVYGYDLTTALRNVARITPSSKLSELLNGMSVTINSGGDIKSFFEKRAESLMLEYRIEREKFAKVAETFMDVYISMVIATPMILMLLLIMISVAGISTGFGISELTVAIIGVVSILNIIFLTFLHLKQPSY